MVNEPGNCGEIIEYRTDDVMKMKFAKLFTNFIFYDVTIRYSIAVVHELTKRTEEKLFADWAQ